MQLSADIKWTDYSSLARMTRYLSRFICSEKLKFKKIFKEETQCSSDRVEISIKCGKVAKRSSFLFLRCSRNKSRIIGVCSTNKLVDLIDDFDFLESQMNQSNLTFTLSDPKVFLDNNKLFDNIDKRRLPIKTVLADLIGTIGFVSGAISFIILEEFNLITAVAFILCLIFWMGSIILGSGNKTKYVLIEQE